MTCLSSVGCNSIESDWKGAQKDDSVASYSAYISKHLQGKYLDQARRKLRDAEWRAAGQADTGEAYRRYLSGSPEGTDPHAAEARIKLDHAEWVVATRADSVSSYQEYLANHASGLHAQEAEGNIEKLEPYEKADGDIANSFVLRSTGRIEWDDKGVMSGGPVTISVGGHAIRLTDSMIRSGLISTADYGKIQIKPGQGFGAELFLKPSQQKKLRSLLAARK